MRFLLLLLFALPVLAARAEPIDFFTPDGVRYDPAIPTPDAFLGFGLGERPVRHGRMVDYLRAVAALSPRMTIETIGHSHEGRPIEFLVVTSPDNHARLDAVRTAHLALADPSSNADIQDDMPVVAWLNYGVHGAESSGMDAAIPVLYHLAAATGEDIERTLRESVIVITAIFNPDGHSRRIDHVERFSSKAPVTDPAHAAHDLWMTARTNHYWFDLNRQWLLQTQPESQAWLAKWHYWKPNVTVDFHEMGSNATYYFHPGEPRRKNPLIPDRSRELLGAMAGFHAQTLDREGYLYYTEEGFDNYYIGKGSTYPHVNGSVGILFEAAAARGGAIETPNGIRRHADNIRHHFLTSLSSIEGARALSRDLLVHQQAFYRDSLKLAADDPVKAYVLSSSDPARLRMFLDLLERHRIEVYRLGRDIDIDGRAYQAGSAFVIPMAQAQYRMIRGIFDRVRQFEEAVFYDVSGWTLPLAYDIDHAPVAKRQWSNALLGGKAVAAAPAVAGPERSDYGYVFGWDDYFAPKALYRLLAAGLRANVGLRPFTLTTKAGPVSFGRGAIFVPLAGQERTADEIHDLLAALGREEAIPVHAALSGLTPGAGADLGARESFAPLEKPSVLLLFDDGISASDAGEIWHLLDHQMQMPVTLKQKDGLSGLDWSRYSHVVLPGGRISIDDRLADRLGRFVREEGGTLIATRQAAVWAQKTLFGKKADKKNDDAENGAPPVRRDYADMPAADAVDVIGGALFNSDLDISHPLAFGHHDRMVASHRNTTLALDAPDNPYAVVARYDSAEPVLSGYASEKRISELKGAPMLIAERLGRGSVILFADDPVFRATFPGTARLLMNAFFFADAFDAPRGGEDEAAMAETH